MSAPTAVATPIARQLPPLVHVRPATQAEEAGAGEAPSAAANESANESPKDAESGARTLSRDRLAHELQQGTLDRDSEVFFSGAEDWVPAHTVAELWVPLDAAQIAALEATEAVATQERSSEPGAPSSRRSLPPSVRRGGSVATVLVALGAGLALLAAAGLGVYFFFFRYAPLAVRHLPKKCVVAARIELVDWALFKPFAQTLLPAIDEAARPTTPPTGPGGPSLKERLRVHAGIDLDRDVREIGVCVFDEPSVAETHGEGRGSPDPLRGYRGVIAIGGRLHAGAIPGIYEALRGESYASSLRLEGGGESAIVRLTTGIGGVIGQAADGTILFAPTDAALAAARPAREDVEAHTQSGLDGKAAFELQTGHLVVGLLPYAASSKELTAARIDSDWLDTIAKGSDAHLAVVLGRAPNVELTLDYPHESAAKAADSSLHDLLGVAREAIGTSATDHAGEHGAIGGARVAREDTRVTVHLDFRFDDVDRGAHEVATMLRDPASPLRARTLPTLGYKLGLGPPPPAASASAGATAPTSPAPSRSADFEAPSHGPHPFE